jgi:GTP 3',8-cyclase
LINLLALEINAVTHCNLACIGCSHSSPVAPSSCADPVVVFRDLSSLSQVVRIKELRILGGEPLLHPDLEGVVRAARSTSIGGIIRVYTNGTRLARDNLKWLRYTDELQVSIYPGTKISRTDLIRVSEACVEAGVRLIPKRFNSFRLSRPSRPLSDNEAEVVYDTCQMAHSRSCHVVQAGRVYLCPPSAPARIGLTNNESCPIDPVIDLESRLSAFLENKHPLSSCADCLGTVGNRVEHKQGNARSWVEFSTRGEIDWDQVEVLRQEPEADNGCCSIEEI